MRWLAALVFLALVLGGAWLYLREEQRVIDVAAAEETRRAMLAVRRGLEVYAGQHGGQLPSTEQGLGPAARWFGDYAGQAPPLDGWGRPLIYRSPAGERPYELVSWGADGAEGGRGADRDLHDWDP